MNSYRHFFLYAKGHYKQGDFIEDLGKLCTDYMGHDLHKPNDRIRILINTLDTLKKSISASALFNRVVDNGYEYNIPFDFGMKPVSLEKAIIKSVLDILAHSKVDEIEGELGDPDFSILPRR